PPTLFLHNLKPDIQKLRNQLDLRLRMQAQWECPIRPRARERQRQQELIGQVLADGDVGGEIGPHLLHYAFGYGFGADADLSDRGENFGHGLAFELQEDGVARTGGVDAADFEARGVPTRETAE